MNRKNTLLLAFLSLTILACGGAPVAPAGGADDASGDAGAPPAAAAPTPATPAAAAPTKNFPGLDYLQQIPVAYRVARANPEVLANIPCYCPCMLYGHGALADCHRSQHSAGCATCLEEAVLAGQIIQQMGADDPQAVAAQVKNRYRGAVVRSHVESNAYPNLQSDGGRAYLQACSDCHRPPHPGMYTADEWRRSLARMEAYARQRDMEPDPAIWQRAVDYLRSTSAQFPAEARDNYRQSLVTAVEHLKATEGDSVYYPSPQDAVLAPGWFERMVEAYRLARDIPAEALAAIELEDPEGGCSNLLDCLNTGRAVTSEAAVAAVERLAAQRGADDD